MRLVLCEQLKRTPKSRTQQNKSGKEPQRKKKWYHWKWTPFTIAENKLKSHERLNGNWKYFSTPDNHFDEPGATQCILGVNESPSMRLLQDEVKKKNQFPTAASLITTNLYPRYHCDTTALPEGLEVAKLLVEHPGPVQSTIVSFLEATIGKEKRKVRKKSEKEKCILFSYPQTVKLNDRLIIPPRSLNYISWRRMFTP